MAPTGVDEHDQDLLAGIAAKHGSRRQQVQVLAAHLRDRLAAGACATSSAQLLHQNLAQRPAATLRSSLSGQQANRVGRKSRGRTALSSELLSNGPDLTRRPLARGQMVNLVVSFSGQMRSEER